MKKDRDAYIVIAPTGKSKIYSIAARRIGSKERYSVVATCSSDTLAQHIVDGLRLLQGEVLELETIAQHTLGDVRQRLITEQTLIGELRDKIRTFQLKETEFERKIRDANRERDAAQKIARESA